ncbi:MAG: class I SAM-dependent methyltransferase [Planctomycetes bacterium]|nr:class I SAM-dependent methyltransferase [Planctomycetota bacterium]
MVEDREKARQELTEQLRSAKSQAVRNKLGQFATPASLASDIVRQALSLLGRGRSIRFLEPGFGTGSFYSALLRSASPSHIETAAGYEIDAHYFEQSARLWDGTGLRLHHADFTRVEPPQTEADRYNLVVCNPPYVRHHHLDSSQKQELQAIVSRRLHFQMNGLGGLYTYFMALSQTWMSKGGVGAWLVPSEFMDVNYGRKVKELLVSRVTLHRLHRFDPNEVQFEDALVSSVVVFFTNALPSDNHQVEFSFGGTLDEPRVSTLVGLNQVYKTPKWTHLPQSAVEHDRKDSTGTLADLFAIKRGLATGCNSFFVLSAEEVQRHSLPAQFLRPILPSPRDIAGDEILADKAGEPLIAKRRYLVHCDLCAERIRAEYESFWRYLEYGIERGIHKRYLCRHREPWYSQENRPPAPFLCTYMGRPTARSESPFRFILNHSQATAANVYLMLYPKPRLATLLQGNPEVSRVIWKALSSVTPESLVGHGRTYGGGLYKLEPKELANLPADVILDVLPKGTKMRSHRQLSLFGM